MSEMVERVAIKIEDALEGLGINLARSEAVLVARAAIEAMREPTPTLLTAIRDAMLPETDREGNLDEGAENRVLQAMIDAALK